MGRINSYQKLKNEIRDQEARINILEDYILGKLSHQEKLTVLTGIMHKRNVDKAMWFGNTSLILKKKVPIGGLIRHLSNHESSTNLKNPKP